MPKTNSTPDPEMPLADARREAFARAVARGVHRTEAFRQAGIGNSRNAAWAAARRPEVKARIEALTRREARIATAATAPTLAALVRLVDRLQGATGPRAREARLTLELIADLRAAVDQDMHKAANPPPPPRPAFTPVPQLTQEEWMEKFAYLREAEAARVKARSQT
ncbi:MAG: hypothetical protein JO107_07550 [Hyphomicrobiales bacterium]|nr:hypothetical protein [Hyphomicrobiales bacterium]